MGAVRAVDERIGKLATRQHGLVTHGQLRALGLGRSAIRHRRESGRIHPVLVGVYAVGHTAFTEEARLLAPVMACGPHALLGHAHAAHLWALLPAWVEIDLATINVVVPPDCGRGRRRGIAVHRIAIDPRDRTSHKGIPVTTPARTILDLGAQTDLRGVERAIDQAITDRRTTPRELRDLLSRSPGSPGAAKLRSLLDGAERFDTLTRSQLEEAFLRLVRESRLPDPSLNARIEGLRVDAVWRRERVAVELDGYRWHRTRTRIESDRERELRLRQAGWTPVRYSARQVLDEPLVVLADLAAVLAGRRA